MKQKGRGARGRRVGTSLEVSRSGSAQLGRHRASASAQPRVAEPRLGTHYWFAWERGREDDEEGQRDASRIGGLETGRTAQGRRVTFGNGQRTGGPIGPENFLSHSGLPGPLFCYVSLAPTPFLLVPRLRYEWCPHVATALWGAINPTGDRLSRRAQPCNHLTPYQPWCQGTGTTYYNHRFSGNPRLPSSSTTPRLHPHVPLCTCHTRAFPKHTFAAATYVDTYRIHVPTSSL